VTVHAVAAVPAAPLLLPAVARGLPDHLADEVSRLRAEVGVALRSLGPADTVVLLAGGDDGTLRDGGCVDLAGYGHPQVTRDVPVDRELLAAIATRTGTPRVRADTLTGDLAVLALLVHEALPDAQVLPTAVAYGAAGATLSGLAAGVVAGVDAVGRRTAVVAAGDLASTRTTASPGYLVEGATGWDDDAVAAVIARDPAALAALGPAEARRVGARGWSSLVVLLHVARAAGVRLPDPQLSAPRGVGQLVVASS
jgi:hypothetical protein